MHNVTLFPLLLVALPHRIASHSDHLDWGYSETIANLKPSEWSKKFDQCGSSNKLQSPINIVSNETIPIKTESPFHYFGDCVINNVTHLPYFHLVYLKKSSCGVVREKQRYALLQIHPHVPAEHTIDGKQYDAEIHFVHSNSESKLLVVAVLIQKSESSDLWVSRYIKMLEVHQNGTKPDDRNGNSSKAITSFLKKNSNVYSYTGGLTTPPCTGGVTFMIVSMPMKVSTEDFALLMHSQQKLVSAKDGNNARPIQPLHERKVFSFAGKEI
uniref:carbonic anhydrase n=1 Tax=Albugo laibachii Nc14 TaxID=890382 RepID=F0W1D2_9STRA|nr:carbonic anhydrase putative [Albugo laibachii Nc14]|eukprot:CCA14860.1 carbonic anhydrase putative [Albugo laibachii Nc14]